MTLMGRSNGVKPQNMAFCVATFDCAIMSYIIRAIIILPMVIHAITIHTTS